MNMADEAIQYKYVISDYQFLYSLLLILIWSEKLKFEYTFNLYVNFGKVK